MLLLPLFSVVFVFVVVAVVVTAATAPCVKLLGDFALGTNPFKSMNDLELARPTKT